jgi:hypothetical protein
MFNVPEKMVLRIFRPRREKVTGGGGGGGRKMKDNKLNCFCLAGNRGKKIRKNEADKTWKRHIRNMNKVLAEERDGKRPLGRSKHTCEDIMKIILMETHYQRV